MEQQLKKRKKRKEYLLLTDFECLTNDEVVNTISEIRVKLKSIFKTHIGQENSITPVELFERVYGINPTMIDIFKRNYWWGILKNVLRQLRREEELFVINKGTKLFVLKTKEESQMFKKKVDSDIKRMEEIKVKADKWVRNRKWSRL